MDIKRRGPKFTPEELTSLQSIVEKYINVIENKKTDKYWNRKKQQAWFLVAQEYNTQHSVHRSELNLQNAYRNMKIRTKKSTPAVKDEKLQPQGTSMEKKYKAVLKCCVNLVKVHGRPVEIFDDKAFQDLLDMIPITVKERRMLTADNIKMMIEEGNSGDVDDDNNDEWDNSLDSRDHLADNDDSTQITVQIKKELVKCSCPTRSDSNETTHAQDCPKYTNPTYWSLFSVSVEDATCTLCGDVIMWSELSELKRHLTCKHPDVDFVDDDDQFSRGPPSSVGSREDQDDLILPEDLQQPEPNEPKKPTINLPRQSRASRKMLSQPYYRKIAPKPAAVFCVQGVPTDPIDKPFIERCKSLDTFGAYIASLMKLLPDDVSTKLQRQIVDRVLAAAG